MRIISLPPWRQLVLFPILFWSPGIVGAMTSTVVGTVDQSVVRILVAADDGDRTGSGFVINKEGYILTNHHVTEKASKILVITGPKKGGEAKMIWESKKMDVALIHLKGIDRPPITLATTLPEKGAMVHAFGFPGAADALTGSDAIEDADWSESSKTEGTIGRILHTNWGEGGDKFAVLQHSASISGGNSGGPLVDDCGRVVGINTATPEEEVPGVFYASHIIVSLAELKKRSISFTLVDTPCVPNAAVPPPATVAKAPPPVTTTPDVVPPPGSAPPAATHWPLIMAMALLFAGGLGYLLLRKRKVPNSDTPAKAVNFPHPLPTVAEEWLLSGLDSRGRPVHLPLSRATLTHSDKGLVIGRERGLCDLVIDDDSLSRRHTRLMWFDGNIYAEDLNTTNGTKAHGRTRPPFQPLLLNEGGQLQLGDVALTLRRTSAKKG